MKSVRLLVLASVSLSFVANAAHALDFRSVGAAPAVLFDAPSERGRKVFVAPRGMPVEVVFANGDWTKVRDASGDLFWIESKALVPKRVVVVRVPNAKVRNAADESAAVAYTADKGVLLELSEPASSGWLKVRHRDGVSGYVKASDVWGG